MRKGICGVTLALALLLSGCSALPYPREMGNMALLRTMGIDLEEEDVRVTVSTGTRARGLQSETEEAMALSAAASSLSGAVTALRGMSDSFVFFGYVDQLLVGESLAKAGLTRTLDFFARDDELSLGAQMWVVRGDAGSATASGNGEGPDQRLETIQRDGEMGAAVLSRSAGEVFADVQDLGSAFVPALRLNEESGALTPAGYAVFRGDRLAGYLEGEAARGLEMLEGHAPEGVLEEAVGSQPQSVRVVWTGNRVSYGDGGMDLNLRAWAQLMEYGSSLTEGERAALARETERRLTGQVQAALSQLRSWGADCTGLGRRAALRTPERLERTGEGWAEEFSRMTIRVRVRTELQE